MLVSLVSIGYSALSSSLMVTGEANFRVREDVRITGLKVLSTSNSGGEIYPSEYYKDGTKVMVTLPNLTSTITYQVEVTNNTKVDYYLKSKTDATNSNTAMKYTLSGASDDKTPIKANAKSTFNIVISYNTGTLPSNKNLTLETRFEFDILDVTPPTVSFSPMGGSYQAFQTVTITASDEHYDHMDVEVQNSNGKMTDKSQTNIKTTTFQVSLDDYDSYKILVKAYDQRENTQTNEPLDNNGYTYQEYVIKKSGEQSTKHLKSKANSSSITSYGSGDKTQMYTFSHAATRQTEVLTDYRYIGNTPYNYVYFNCKAEPQNPSNCETWRIIGIFSVDDGTGKIEERMKIIRDALIEDMAWNSGGTNNWQSASLMTYLNGTYLNNLSSTAQSMIGNAKFYLGGSSTYQNLGGPDYYNFERGTTVYDTSRPTSWVGKIALMYPSDYVYTYALGVNDKCYNDGYNCDTGTPSAGWLFNSKLQWTLAPSSGRSDLAFNVHSTGYVNNDYGSGYSYVAYTRGVRPALYLASNVSIVDGDGSSGNPYQLAI